MLSSLFRRMRLSPSVPSALSRFSNPPAQPSFQMLPAQNNFVPMLNCTQQTRRSYKTVANRQPQELFYERLMHSTHWIPKESYVCTRLTSLLNRQNFPEGYNFRSFRTLQEVDNQHHVQCSLWITDQETKAIIAEMDFNLNLETREYKFQALSISPAHHSIQIAQKPLREFLLECSVITGLLYHCGSFYVPSEEALDFCTRIGFDKIHRAPMSIFHLDINDAAHQMGFTSAIDESCQSDVMQLVTNICQLNSENPGGVSPTTLGKFILRDFLYNTDYESRTMVKRF